MKVYAGLCDYWEIDHSDSDEPLLRWSQSFPVWGPEVQRGISQCPEPLVEDVWRGTGSSS